MQSYSQFRHDDKSIFQRKFIGYLMQKGEAQIARGIFEACLERLGSVEIVRRAINNVKPIFETKRVRVSGVTREIPRLVAIHRQEGLAIRWIIKAAREKKKKNPKYSFAQTLASEIMDASKAIGSAKNQRDQLHKQAEQNRAFIHFFR